MIYQYFVLFSSNLECFRPESMTKLQTDLFLLVVQFNQQILIPVECQ